MMDYEDMLVQADKERDSKLRLMKVVCFCIGQYTPSQKRICKPFNPLLGETFELMCPRFKFIGE